MDGLMVCMVGMVGMVGMRAHACVKMNAAFTMKIDGLVSRYFR